MAFDDPAALDLAALFRDAAMFESRAAWRAAGFHVVEGVGKIMVAGHPRIRGLLFKKYSGAVGEKDQRKNYERRVKGADRLRILIAARGLRRVVVPRKWILELPRGVFRGEPASVLVVEQLELLGSEQTKAAYEGIELQVLAELCVVVFHYRGMDSNARNIPFVADGRIAFVDTEHWDRGSSKGYLHHVGGYLSRDRRKFADDLFRELEDAGGRSVDFSDGEDTSTSS